MILCFLQPPIVKEAFPELTDKGCFLHIFGSVNCQIELVGILPGNLPIVDQALTGTFSFCLRVVYCYLSKHVDRYTGVDPVTEYNDSDTVPWGIVFLGLLNAVEYRKNICIVVIARAFD